MMVVPQHKLFVAWCMMELEERRGRTRDSLERQADCWESSAPAWDRAHHPHHGNIMMTIAITKICSRGASIMESETTTHLIALTVVDSYLKQAASCGEGKGSVCITLGASVSASYSNAIHIRMDISRSMGTRTRKNTTVFMSPCCMVKDNT